MKSLDKANLVIGCVWLASVIRGGAQLNLFDITYLFVMVMAYYGVDAIGAAILRQIIFIATSILRNANENRAGR